MAAPKNMSFFYHSVIIKIFLDLAFCFPLNATQFDRLHRRLLKYTISLERFVFSFLLNWEFGQNLRYIHLNKRETEREFEQCHQGKLKIGRDLVV